MSILSDKSIIARCDVDAVIYDEAMFEMAKFEHLYDILMGRKYPHDLNYLLSAARKSAYRKRTPVEAQAFQPMIEPFTPGQIKKHLLRKQAPDLDYRGQKIPMPPKEITEIPIISRGLTSYGYDVSLAPKFKVFSNINSAVIDPKRIDPECFVDIEAKIDPITGESYVLMPPNSYLLGSTVETFNIPRDVMVICVGKSTYARSGGIVNVTPIEPGFRGNVVIEISNSTNLPARVYANEGIAQFMFFQGNEPCETSYADRAGKYQDQTGLTLPKV